MTFVLALKRRRIVVLLCHLLRATVKTELGWRQSVHVTSFGTGNGEIKNTECGGHSSKFK